ncbi:chaperone protein DnaJ 1-like [Amphibalanus amphitrite]|uniref:chaperone protein DnaJ 1-like n=1 Tax=Amphibalanus amphitrite TaxID=1232801 RepID=UPI001C9008CF|nr:chaperone protein DnaJ 1-like [Amphibalanus amphitrite]XP_043209581.1 chaperone protein DnaJ 1-like [Amphibalanus amphitrite]
MDTFIGCLLCIYLLSLTQRSLGAAFKDYYKVMGLDREATKREIKERFKKLAVLYHPDKNHSPEAEARFYEVQQAFEVLSDPIQRGMFDINLGLAERYPEMVERHNARGGHRRRMPVFNNLRAVHEAVPDAQPSFDSGNVVTGFYVGMDQVSGFQPPPDRILRPRGSLRLPESGWDTEDGSITCSTFKEEGVDGRAHLHTQCS